jgi:ParB-like chromosome segregation protein Spo0J
LTLQTTLYRARCRRPVLIERMKQSLAVHGQLQPVVAVERDGKPDLIDGFKRREGAAALGWETLYVAVIPFDEVGQWATMLALNRGPQSMTELEEALVLRELAATGMTQVEIAALVQRHKSWVSRRVGLVERLHAELVEGMKLGLLHPGVARRLLPLPPGNQLELAAAAQSAGLGPRDTELLVSLWQRAKDPDVRSYLLREPRAALRRARPELGPPPDPRLGPRSRQLLRLLRLLQGVATRAADLLEPAPPEPDLRILAPDLRATSQATSGLLTALGRVESASGGGASAASAATSSSAG